ncbi:hypothetical protein [Methylobacterium gnaphalii]|uniref:Uncharacterized protein n=1 Tax=Methylobacterium gnaphalii TaxID=1010610 RepID=A0A512JLA4_9HYPH|nr:hypothetical protein [Methylobacterium gnaphalii]GEP10731.1 hypothetical protein MGN01_25760 [Methylobacterium gnaphalii]GJD67397.1 hypothetical protein MMMDOFMJ_0312 [Methylobacterium gnaphalii]GLS49271.1 hypothetical protein GCM10007885_21190 [Methylobacterium gnaphalii]
MRLPLIACLVLTSTTAFAEPAATVVGCDNLVTLRRLTVQNPEGSDIPPEFSGCRAVPADRVGEVEKRSMIGDVPYECRSVKEASCLWIRP